jgi:eukaryotic-like serine/threonine-protein kinase
MSPEQARGEPLDGRSDIYSLGVVGFLAASGRLPLDESAASSSLARLIAGASVVPVATVSTGLMASLARTIDRCLEGDASRRFATAEDVATAILAAQPDRNTLPASLAYWASEPAPMVGFYGVWSAGWIWMMIVQAMVMRHRLGTNFAAIALLPVVPMSIFELRKAYKALAAGYSIDDLLAALRTWIEQRRRELDVAAELAEPLWVGALRMLPVLFAAAIPVAFAITRMLGVDVLRTPTPFLEAFVAGLATAGVASFGIAAGLGIPLLPPSYERKVVGRLRSRIWNSRFGAWLARKLTPKERGVPESSFRPTEIALEAAVDDLFAALPTVYREVVGDLPEIGHRLAQHIGELRSEVDRLETMKSHSPREDHLTIDPLLASARGQLRETVGTLEGIRMELLRLHGGAGGLRPLTTSLDSARRMVGNITRLREAENEIEPGARRRLAIDVQNPSPV